jgi:hypothetical protein
MYTQRSHVLDLRHKRLPNLQYALSINLAPGFWNDCNDLDLLSLFMKIRI